MVLGIVNLMAFIGYLIMSGILLLSAFVLAVPAFVVCSLLFSDGKRFLE
ncbi:MAG: hypothetical protein KDD61_09745 [Bdellovibrionales bacterium]|nr:hypothetical protein [Bdellovibrionales bacterium]